LRANGIALKKSGVKSGADRIISKRKLNMAKKETAKKEESSIMDSVREVAQTIFPGAKKRQARRDKRRSAVTKLVKQISKKK
jgi:hypothetical protein